MSNTNYTCGNISILNNLNNKSLNNMKHNTRYEKNPNLFSIKIMNNNKDDIFQSQFKKDRFNSAQHYKTSFSFYRSKVKRNSATKINILNSQNEFLTDRVKSENEKNNINEEDKFDFSKVKDVLKTNNNENISNNRVNEKINTFINKSYNKGILKNISRHKKSHKNVMKYNSYEKNKKILKRPLTYLKSACNRKNKKYLIQNIV